MINLIIINIINMKANKLVILLNGTLFNLVDIPALEKVMLLF